MAANKVYDGTTNATIPNAGLTGVIANDDVFISNSIGSFDSKNIGTEKTVSLTITIAGMDVTNYELIQPTGITASIFAKPLSISNLTVENKEYDGTTNVTISSTGLVGVIENDEVIINNLTGVFDSKHVGVAKPVTPSLTLNGSDAMNYSVHFSSELFANITPKELTISGSSIAKDKSEDGNIIATTSTNDLTLNGKINGDVVGLSDLMVAFENPEPGENKKVMLTAATLSGQDSDNYELNLTNSPTALANIFVTLSTSNTGQHAYFKIYPNPTTGAVFLNQMQKLDRNTIVQVYSPQGQLIYKKLNVINRMKIDLSAHKAGLYLIKFVTNEEVLIKPVMLK